MKMLLVLVFVIVLCSSTTPLVSQNTTNSINVFILAGQSNMVGIGSLGNGNVPPECQPNPRILRLSQELKWEEAHEPLHKLVNNSNQFFGIGPGIPFANSLLKRDPDVGVIGLVPCAVSGSSITNWNCRDGAIYKNMVARARAAATDGSVVRAFLWYQGESDADTPEEAEAYGGRLVELFSSVRADLQSPSLPIIQVALASGGQYKEKIREVQLHTDLPNVKCVDADGLPLNPQDHVHLTTPAQVQLGSMLADAYLCMLSLDQCNQSSGVEKYKY